MGHQFTFPVDKFVEGDELKGFSEFDLYIDGKGRTLRLTRLSDDCVNDAIADGEVMVFKADGTATNDVSAAVLLGVARAPAGVALGAIAESSAVGDTTSGQKYVWLLIKGYHSAVITDAGNDIAAFDSLTVSESVDGACDRFIPGGTFDQDDLEHLTRGIIGFAVADDIDADDTVEAFIDIK